MNSKLAVGVVVVLVLVGGVAGAFALGVIPGAGGNGGGGGGGGDATQTYESTVVVDGSGTDSGGSTADGGAATTESQPPFSFVIDNIEKCGQRCRNVTATITNNQNTTATGVTVRSEIFTGSNYDNKIWEGTSDAGDMEPGASFTDKKTVQLGYSEAYAVQQNDGEILIKTFIVTDDATYVFKEKRDVL